MDDYRTVTGAYYDTVPSVMYEFLPGDWSKRNNWIGLT
jgi:hypothetical protein